MDEVGFWRVVSETGGSARAVGLERLGWALRRLPAGEVEQFALLLVGKMYALDTTAHFEAPVFGADHGEPVDPEPVDAELFVNVRLAVVLAGRQTYDEVLADPTALSRRAWPELFAAHGLLHRVEQVCAERGVAGGMPGLDLAQTGSNPLFAPELLLPGGFDPPSNPWLGLTCRPDQAAFGRSLPGPRAQLQFTLLLDAVLDQLAAVDGFRELFAAHGFRAVLLTLELGPAGWPPATGFRDDGDRLHVDLHRPFPLHEPTPHQITDWARQVLTEALDLAARHLNRSGGTRQEGPGHGAPEHDEPDQSDSERGGESTRGQGHRTWRGRL
ncbi:DUF4240 domain-containing protein [Kineosporia sp. J2-2]|uniref:DUF4240 domain-containing protein n=1 Tax=Kineosporia corallincola TaxID=2835133 RepID=A0ABS5TFS7_9ACTN|nr:DUF4240 domain-containing protein [Kineosporia corallincola]MBT0769932.1 DUF4240 domain-containing protein [Kineosporia corallincola]